MSPWPPAKSSPVPKKLCAYRLGPGSIGTFRTAGAWLRYLQYIENNIPLTFAMWRFALFYICASLFSVIAESPKLTVFKDVMRDMRAKTICRVCETYQDKIEACKLLPLHIVTSGISHLCC